MEDHIDPRDEELDFEEPEEEEEPSLEGICHNCYKECKPGETFCCPECAKEYDADLEEEPDDLDVGEGFDEEEEK
jgi:predicted amidophosphoribosyltransferase